MNTTLGSLLCIACAMFLACASCSTTQPTRLWQDPGYAGGGFEKVLVIGVAKHPPVREVFEDEFVRKLKARGVKALASHTVLATDKKADRDFIVAKVKDLGVDAVFVSRVTEAKERLDLDDAASLYRVPIAAVNVKLHEEYMKKHGTVNPASVLVQYKELIMETKVYEAASEKAIWSLESKTHVQDAFSKLLDSYLDVVIKNLSKSKLLPL